MGATQSNEYANEVPKNNEDFQLIWLDALIRECSDTNMTMKMLRSLNFSAQFYTDIDKCMKLIPYMSNKHILIVVSGSFAHIILPFVYKKNYVRGIFIFDEIHQFYTDLFNEYPLKLIDICTDRVTLSKSISKTMKMIENEDFYFRLYHSKQYLTHQLTNESKLFIKNYLWNCAMKTLSTDERAKNEMFEYCQDYFQQNKKQLKKIESLRQNYTSKSFIYKFVNKVLCSEDIQLSYKFRYFINDLCAELEKEKLISENSIFFYRNQLIKKSKFDNLMKNIGSIISINSFLLTSRDKRIFNKVSSSPSWLNDTIQTQITISANKQHVLFSRGSVFRIEKCEYDEKLCLGKLLLIATNEGETIFQSYLDLQKDQIEFYSLLIFFGRYLTIELDKINQTEDYFQMLLKTLPHDHPDISDIYNQIGVVHYIYSRNENIDQNSEQSLALEMFEKAMEMRRNIFGNNHIQIANSLNSIGSVYNDRGQYDRALECYENGLKIIENNQAKNTIIHANLQTNCGIRELRLKNYEATLLFYIKAYEIYSSVMHPHNSSLINKALEIAQLSVDTNNISTAVQYYQQAFHCCETIWLSTDEKFRCCWTHIVRDYLKIDRTEYLSLMSKISNEYNWSMAQLCAEAMHFQLALNYYQTYFQLETKYIDQFLSMKLVLDLDINEEEEICMDDREKQIEVLKFKLLIYEKLFPINDIQHALFLVDIGQLLYFHDLIDLACECYLKAFDIYETLPIQEIEINLIRNCFNCLIKIYIENNDEQSMKKILERTLKKYNSFKKMNCFEDIAHEYGQKNDTSNWLYYLEKAFTQDEMTYSYENLLYLLEKLMEYYIKNENEQQIKIFVQRAVKICEKDCEQLIIYHEKIGEIFEYNNWKSQALEQFEQLFIVTESNHSSSMEFLLDKLWIDFITNDRSIFYSFGSLGQTLTMHELLRICQKHLPSNHIKLAIVFWYNAILYERAEIMNMALQFFSKATSIFETFVYNDNDIRAKQMLNYLVFRNLDDYTLNDFLIWLECPQTSSFRRIGCANSSEKWKCILQRLNLYKMIHIDNQWKFHLKIENLVLNSKLCKILFDKCLEICHDSENNTSLIISSLEFISHWYFIRDQFLQSLSYRQQQLEFEYKLFHKHPHVAFSLWFIGLIFQKMKDYHYALGYFNQAMKIFESFQPKTHQDICQLDKHISQIKQFINDDDNQSTIENVMINQRIKFGTNQYKPQLLQKSFHID